MSQPDSDPTKKPDPDPLPSKPSAGQVIGGMLAGLEGLVTGRPKTVAQIEEQYTEMGVSGRSHRGWTRRADRPPRAPDRSGARL